MINPVRIVFEGRTRTAKVNVANTNPEPVRYRVSLVTMRKNDAGNLVEIEIENENERDKLTKSLIRFSPRCATILPGKRQVVKLMVRKPDNLPQGEYQTRLRFMPLADPVTSSGSQSEAASGLQFKIDLIVGVTIPVVIQHEKVDTTVSPQGLVLQKYAQVPSGLAAVITLSRSGHYSAFGDVIVSYLGVAGRDKKNIGQGEKIGIYIPDSHRTFAIPLQSLENLDLNSGKLRVEFFHHLQSNRPPVISYKEFSLSP